MSLWRRLFPPKAPASEAKDTQSRVLISLQNSGPYVPTPRDYESFAKEGYQKNVVAFRSISWVAANCGGVPWTLFKKAKSKGSKRTEILQSPFLDLIARPNPMQGRGAFFEAAVAYKLISGNSYIQGAGPGQGPSAKVTELWTLRPDRMKIVPGARGYPAAYTYLVNDRSVSFPVDQVTLKSPVLHWKFFNPIDDWYGMSPIEAVVYGIDSHTACSKWNLSLMQNSARPSGALIAQVTATNSGVLGEEQFQRLKQELHENYTGAGNAGRPMVLDGGLDWKQMSLSPQQMEFIENKNTSARDIALAFGVPPMLLGIPGDNTYSNYQEARAALYEDTILPLMESLLGEFNHWLVPLFGDGLEADYDKDSIHALAPRRLMIWDKIQSADWLTLNEKREATGYEAVDDGDVILVQSTEVPLEDALNPPDPAPAPGAAGDPEDDEGGANTDQDGPGDDGDEPGAGKEPKKALKSAQDAREGKIFNLPTDRAKQREARGQLRVRAGLQRKMLRQVQAVFEIEGHRVKEAIDGLDAHHAESAARRAIEANHAQWKTVLTRNAQATMQVFGDRVFRSMKAHGGPTELKDAQSKYEAFLKKWIEEHVGEQIDLISDTTRDEILDAIKDAQLENYDSGEGVEALSAKIEEIYEGFTEGRAMTIARTETGIAANTALNQAAKSTGIPGLQKEWVSVNDDRTRPDHVAANGQTVPMDEDFKVGDVALAYPCDPDGPAEEIIQCRCAQVFSRAKAEADNADSADSEDQE